MPLAHMSGVPTHRGPPLVLLALVTAVTPAALHILVPALPSLAAIFDPAAGSRRSGTPADGERILRQRTRHRERDNRYTRTRRVR
jgi:hypothetical protein